MEKKLVRWQAAGFLFTSIAGTLLHFLYDWSGQSPLAAILSGVNESTWEHMKLLFFPMFLFALVEANVLGERHRNFWSAKLAGVLLGLALIPALYYTYTGITGINVDWVNISIFYVAAAAAYLLETKLLSRSRAYSSAAQLGAIAFLWLLAVAFVVLTWFPPHIPLFRDSVTGQYGLYS